MIRLWVREVKDKSARKNKKKKYFAKDVNEWNGADGQTIGRIYVFG